MTNTYWRLVDSLFCVLTYLSMTLMFFGGTNFASIGNSLLTNVVIISVALKLLRDGRKAIVELYEQYVKGSHVE